jgi:Zn-dependent peptidase ImmA (M78 family)
MEMKVVMLDESSGVPSEVCDRLLRCDSRAWSAGTLHLPDGGKLVVMNPTHEVQRQRASLMEEIAHIHLRHRPTQFIHVNGIVLRSWDDSSERQAYWLGATALLPERILKGARTLGKTTEQVAEEHGVSVALVKFRTNTLGIKLGGC